MKKLIGSLMLISAVAGLSGCSETVESGNVGVFVMKSYFEKGGVSNEVAYPGRYFVAPTTELVEYNVQPFKEDEKFHDLITSENVPVSFQASIQMQLIPEKIPELHAKFGPNYYANIIQRQFQNLVRDFARRHTVFELTTNTSVTNNGQEAIKQEVIKMIEKEQLPVNIKGVTIGAVSPPQEVLEETSRTAAQNQRALTEDSRAKAELSRKNAEVNKALADKAYMSEMNMTPSEYLQGKAIDINREMVDSIKGSKNVNILFSIGGNSPIPTFQQQNPTVSK